PYLPYRQ
ncbi:Electron transport complex protein RnfE, partial [Haemophilus influenzae]